MKNKDKKPPRFAVWLLRRFSPEKDRDSLIDDLELEYRELADRKSRPFANLWYISHLFRAVPELVLSLIYWRLTMFKNYLKIAFRNIKRQKIYSLINISGLATGMAVCILIYLYVQHEFSWDSSFKNGDNVYRIISNINSSGESVLNARTPNPLGPYLKDRYPEIVNFFRYLSQGYRFRIGTGDSNFFYDDIPAYADNEIFTVLPLPLVQGNPETALKELMSIVISEKMSKKYFAHENPMGKNIILNGRWTFMVTGVFRDIPESSHIIADFFLPAKIVELFNEINMYDWKKSTISYIQLAEGVSYKEVSKKIENTVLEHYPESGSKIFLQPLSRIHLFSSYLADNNYKKGDYKLVYALIITAVGILIIACINYINLSTAKAALRAKEVGIRKVTGAYKGDIIRQFFGESFILCIFSLILSLFLVYLILPAFNNLTGRNLSLNILKSGNILAGIFILVLVTCIFSGIYPAFILSSFNPVKVLKQIKSFSTRSGIFLRRILVVSQIVCSVFIIFGTIVIYRQIDLLRNKDIGFDKNNIISFLPMDFMHEGRFETIKQELLANPDIISVTVGAAPNDVLYGTANFSWEGKNSENNFVIYPLRVDYNYLETYGLKLTQGRFFSKDMQSDTNKVLINEAACKAMGLTSPLGKIVTFSYYGFRKAEIIGVVKDFQFSSLRNPVEPVLLSSRERGGLPIFSFKFNPACTSRVIEFMNNLWKRISNYPVSYQFVDEKIDNYYNNEKKIGTVSLYIAAVTLIIACMGLFGLVSFISERKFKEIGIRKVLGASTGSILLIYIREFLILIAVASLITFPPGYFVFKKALENYTSRINISADIFILSFFIMLVIALVTVLYQTVKSARTNPVDSLRYE